MRFQYISCYSLSLLKQCVQPWIFVSIHLMLLFIKSEDLKDYSKICFNTSHVTLYRWSALWPNITNTSFNTSHVTLYLVAGNMFKLPTEFQYISCYSLSGIPMQKLLTMNVSIHLMLLFIEKRHCISCNQRKFQYISCYSLSNFAGIGVTKNGGFNTSHVTLYQQSTWTRMIIYHVSIHLMLLFIYVPNASQSDRITFQYISCYSLSGFRRSDSSFLPCFNTSHVTLYRLRKISGRYAARSFNTSHVTLYHMTKRQKDLRNQFQYISCYSLSLVL